MADIPNHVPRLFLDDVLLHEESLRRDRLAQGGGLTCPDASLNPWQVDEALQVRRQVPSRLSRGKGLPA